MFLVALLALSSALTQEEEDELILRPPHLSDFIAARQVRNLTVSGQKELAPIYGRYFRKPLIELLQSTQPHALQLRSMYFKSFDGMVIKGEARGIVPLANIVVYDCTFTDFRSQAIHIVGPSRQDRFDDEPGGDRSPMDE